MRLTRRLTKHFLLMMLLAIGMAVAFSSHAQLLTKAETSLDIEYTNSEQKLSLDEVKLLDGDLWSELKTIERLLVIPLTSTGSVFS